MTTRRRRKMSGREFFEKHVGGLWTEDTYAVQVAYTILAAQQARIDELEDRMEKLEGAGDA